MKLIKFTFLILCVLGFSLTGRCQSSEEIALDTKYQNFKKMGISVIIVDGWIMKKPDKKAIISFDKLDNKSNFNIQLENYNIVLNKILNNPDDHHKKMNSISSEELIEKINEVTSEAEKKPNSSVSVTFVRTISKQEGNKELITTYKTINNKGFIIHASIDNNCRVCIDQLNNMIESIKEL